jgi:hypothetical protein
LLVELVDCAIATDPSRRADTAPANTIFFRM